MHYIQCFAILQFYLQDTKSSNGTFINNQRLSRASEESLAVEVNSCDIVQFGVDVVDNAKKGMTLLVVFHCNKKLSGNRRHSGSLLHYCRMYKT